MKNLFLTSLWSATALVLAVSCHEKKQTLFKKLSPAESGIEFTNKINETDTFNILTYEYIYNGGGVGIGDFNNDGLQDLFFAGNKVENKIYLNRGNLKFEDVTSIASVNTTGKWNSGVALVDINNDGWMDIYVTATMLPDSLSRKNKLYVNQGLNKEGIPTFIEQAAQYGIDYGGYSVSSAFFDYDRDGDLDLYILTNVKINNRPTTYRDKIIDGTSPNNDKLYRNNGNGTFTDVTLSANIKEEGFGLGLAISDFNQDGWPDIYVSNDYLSNDILYLNNRNGTFSNVTKKFITHQSQFSMGNDAADINNDRLPDLITLDMLPENNFRKKTTIANKTYQTYIYNEQYNYEYQYVRNMLHLNNGLQDGIKFSEIGQLAGMYQTEWSWSPLTADFDHDGWKDILITNGFPKDITDKDFAHFRVEVGNLATPRMLLDSIPIIKIPHYAFKNLGNLTFKDVSAAWGIDIRSFANAAAIADLDNDGDLDYVVSNINDPAFVFENQLNKTKKENEYAYLKIKFIGNSLNRNGIGTKVTVAQAGKIQYQENSVYRGFLSSIENNVHFGFESRKNIDSLLVEWPDGRTQQLTNISPNQFLTVDYQQATPSKINWMPQHKLKLFHHDNKSLPVYSHTEDDLNDFNNQRTLPHKFSQNGPGLAVGDVDGNGTDDFVVGASAGYSTLLFRQDAKGKFTTTAIQPGKKTQEDAGLLLFDSDRDGDLDLLIASGGMPYSLTNDDYRLRLYINDGKGRFKESKDLLPEIFSVASCVRACDFDRDGDLDIFIGGRVSRMGYPLAGESILLINEHGKFSPSENNDLKNIGMVTDALWSDIDNDGYTDLVLVGEFMPITIFKNDGRTLKRINEPGLNDRIGWWSSIAGGDFDNDGDVDFIIGNYGKNNPYQVDEHHPVVVTMKDFDNNGSIDPVLSSYVRSSMEDSSKKLFPTHFWDELNSQSPLFRRKFRRYNQYGKTTTENLFSKKEIDGATRLEANELRTCYVENRNGQWILHPFQNEIQISPVNGLVVADFNEDGNLDVAGVGNCYANEVFAGRNDAMTGFILLGNGKGNFEYLPSQASSFYVPGDAKALTRVFINGKSSLLASQNRDSLKLFALTQTHSDYFCPAASDSYAILELEDGRKQRIEFYYGSGYLSQSTRALLLPKKRKSFTVFDYSGNPRKIN